MNDGNFLIVKINRKLVRPLLDSGSGYSVISNKLANELGLKIEPLEAGNAQRLFTANGSNLDVIGSVELPITIKNLQFPQTALVIANLSPNNCILGEDFLRNYQVILDYQNCCVSIEDGLVCVPMYNATRKESFVRILKPVCILPYSIATIGVCVSRKFVNKDCLIEPIVGQQFERFAVQRIVTHPNSTTSICRIMNFQGLPCTLRKNEIVATINQVSDVGTLVDRGSVAPISVTAAATANSASQRDRKSAQREPSKQEIEKFLKDYQINISDQLTKEQKTHMQKLLYEFRDLFCRNLSELKRLKIPPYKIQLKSDHACNTRQYNLSQKDKIEADKQITELVNNQLVEESSVESSIKYNNPVLLVPRRNDTPRMVLDFRRINRLIIPMQISLPRIDDLVEQIASSKPQYMTKIDLKSSYWQVPIHKDSQPLLTFTNPLTGKRLMFTSAPFGMVSSGAFFSHAISIILSGLPTSEVLTFVDDIVVMSPKGQFNQHVLRLRQIFELFREYNVSVNNAKCVFAHNSLFFAGTK